MKKTRFTKDQICEDPAQGGSVVTGNYAKYGSGSECKAERRGGGEVLLPQSWGEFGDAGSWRVQWRFR